MPEHDEYFKARNEALEKLIEGVNQEQFGGSHYRKTGFQHWDFVIANKLGYFEGQITKYICRWRDKNGVQDLLKALHYLAKLISALRGGSDAWSNRGMSALRLRDLELTYPKLTPSELNIINLMCAYQNQDDLYVAGILIQDLIQDFAGSNKTGH